MRPLTPDPSSHRRTGHMSSPARLHQPPDTPQFIWNQQRTPDLLLLLLPSSGHRGIAWVTFRALMKNTLSHSLLRPLPILLKWKSKIWNPAGTFDRDNIQISDKVIPETWSRNQFICWSGCWPLLSSVHIASTISTPSRSSRGAHHSGRLGPEPKICLWPIKQTTVTVWNQACKIRQFWILPCGWRHGGPPLLASFWSALLWLPGPRTRAVIQIGN